MTPEERIAQLEEALALERAKVHELSAALAAAVSADAHAKRVAADRKAARAAQNRAAYERRKQIQHPIQHEIQRAETGAESPAPPSPFPSSFPPSPETSSPYPLSFPPSSPPPTDLFPGFADAPQAHSAPPAKKAKEAKKREPTGDPRHAPLVKALTDAGWPFDGGKDAAHVKALLALADQQEATRGDLAGLEVIRRAGIAWSQFPGFHSARTLSGLRSKWGEFAQADTGTRGPAPPSSFDVPAPVKHFEWLDYDKPGGA